MDKLVSDIPGFSGEIIFKDFITIDLVENWLEVEMNTNIPRNEKNETRFAAMCAWIEVWKIENQPEHPTYKTLRATPYIQARMLISQINDAIKREITGIKTIPNASGPRPTDTQKTPASEDQPS